MRESYRQYAISMKGGWTPPADPKPPEGLDDISELLDEMIEEDLNKSKFRPLSEGEVPESIKLLEKLMAQKQEAENEDDF